MSVTIIVGEMGSGKSTELKRRFLSKTKRNVLCYALIQKDMGNYTYDSDFRNLVERGVVMKETMFVIDEARTAIPDAKPQPTKKEWDKKLVTWFLNSRKCGNMIFIVFHGLSEIPVWLLMYTNFLIRYNTIDQINYQITRFRSFPAVVKSLEDFPTIPKFKYDQITLRKP